MLPETLYRYQGVAKSVEPNCVVEKRLLPVQWNNQPLQVLVLEVEDLAAKVLAVEVDREILKATPPESKIALQRLVEVILRASLQETLPVV